MPITYHIVRKHNQIDPDAPQKYYPSIKSSGRVSLRDIAQQIAAMSTVSSIDVYAVLEALITIIPDELTNGNLVDLGDLGSFSVRARTTGEPKEADVSTKNITKLLPRFYPGTRFSETLNKAKVVRAER